MKKKISLITLTMFFLLGIVAPAFAAQPDIVHKTTFDTIIKGGLIVDGTARKGYTADIGISDGKIAKIGDLSTYTAKETIDAAGDVVAPGFIDIHTHADGGIKGNPKAENYVLDGVTTVLGGNCGGGSAKTDVAKFLEDVKAENPSINFATLVGHGDIRQTVMNLTTGEVTTEGYEEMKEMIKDAMLDGAFGISSGLEYIPGRYADTAELIEMAKVANEYGGFYATHMRDEQTGVVSSVAEAIEIGRGAGIPVEISHLKGCGAAVWGVGKTLVQMIKDARAEGIDVTADQYPYGASSTGFSQCFPGWSVVNGVTTLSAILDAPDSSEKAAQVAEIRAYAENQLRIRIGEDFSLIQISSYKANPSYEGMTMEDIMESRGIEPTMENGISLVIEMYLAGGPSVIYHYISPDDIKAIMTSPYVMIASDGSVQRFGKSMPHPRSYGTNARVLGYYVRELNVLSLEEAIQKMTSMPAKKLGLNDRGTIKVGNWADITIFNPDTIIDKATFFNPHQYSEGIDYVIVNGVLTGDHGVHTGAGNGQIIYGPAKKVEK